MLATAVAAAGGGVLLWAALEKARDPASTTATMRRLGLPPVVARGAIAIVIVEIAVATGLIFRPDLILTQAGVALLAVGFALAGLVALLRGEQIRCTCFGRGRGGYLGANQLVALGPWLAGAVYLRLAHVEPPSPSRGAALLAAIALTMAAVRLISVLAVWREARGDRLSARETYVWLTR